MARFDGHSWLAFEASDLPINWVGADGHYVAVDASARAWVASKTGAAWYDAESWQPIEIGAPYGPSDEIMSLECLANGSTWLVTYATVYSDYLSAMPRLYVPLVQSGRLLSKRDSARWLSRHLVPRLERVGPPSWQDQVCICRLD